MLLFGFTAHLMLVTSPTHLILHRLLLLIELLLPWHLLPLINRLLLLWLPLVTRHLLLSLETRLLLSLETGLLSMEARLLLSLETWLLLPLVTRHPLLSRKLILLLHKSLSHTHICVILWNITKRLLLKRMWLLHKVLWAWLLIECNLIGWLLLPNKRIGNCWCRRETWLVDWIGGVAGHYRLFVQ